MYIAYLQFLSALLFPGLLTMLQLQAVIVGNYVMAAITDGDQEVKADPDRINDYLQEVSELGLVTIVSEDGRLLMQSQGSIELVEEGSCLAAMQCTFRLLQVSRQDIRPYLSCCHSYHW